MATTFSESNIGGMSSDLAKSVREAKADTEAEFDGCGQAPGVEVWRVENLGVKKWTKGGKFFQGDSYIVLHTYKKPNSNTVLYNVHFWLGSETSQDEAAVAAFKTVELDDKFGDLPVQYREVDGHESDEFLALFEPAFSTMKGGIDSGFNVVKPTEYKPRLMQVKGKRKAVRVQQVPLECSSLNQGDSFIMDNGMAIVVWNGAKSGIFEKRKANEVATALREDRGSKPTLVIIDGDDECKDFWPLMAGSAADVKSAEDGGDDTAVTKQAKSMWQLSDASGSLQMKQISTGDLSRDALVSDDVCLVDNAGQSLFVWVGKGASKDEKAKAFQYANEYIKDHKLAVHVPVSRVMEGNESTAFDNCFN